MMNTIFFDVDTQNDFMNADGALYVPDAESLKPVLERLTLFALSNDIPIRGSVDCHSKEDAEFIANGGPFPFHCMRNSRGALKIRETAVVDKETYIGSEITISSDGLPRLRSERGSHGGLLPQEWDWLTGNMGAGDHLIFEKQTYDVMTNQTLQLAKKDIEWRMSQNEFSIAAVVYGVATDYCVKAAALGLRGFGMEVCVVEDAIKEITPEGRDEAFAEFEKAGIKLVSSKWVFDNCQKSLT